LRGAMGYINPDIYLYSGTDEVLDIPIQLGKTVQFTGQVVNYQDKGIPNAQILLRIDEDTDTAMVIPQCSTTLVTTDASGFYRINCNLDNP
jgi:hypothetical protein